MTSRGALHTRLAVAACALVAIFHAGEAPAAGPSKQPRLVLLYATCTLNKNFLSPYDSSIAYTPSLQSFSKDAVVFERHQTEAGSSGIAFASIFTGSQATTHGIYRHPNTLRDDQLLIFEAFADAGYETFFWNGHKMASARLNYSQGVTEANIFETFVQADDPAFLEILRKLADDPSYRAFILTNFTITHGPYDRFRLGDFIETFHTDQDAFLIAGSPHIDTYRENFFGLTWNHRATVRRLGLTGKGLREFAAVAQLLYESNVYELDRLFGAVVSSIRAKGLFAESLIAFTADHGEVLYRESAPFKWGHSMQLSADVLGVPLMIHAPGTAAGRYAEVTRSIDVFPTLAGLADVALPSSASVTGVDLSDAVRRNAPPPALLARSHTTVLVKSVARRIKRPDLAHDWAYTRKLFPSDDVKYIWVAIRDRDMVYKNHNPKGVGFEYAAYDLAADPGEKTNIFDAENALHQAMRRELIKYKMSLVRDYRGRSELLLPRREEVEALRAMGYIE